MDKLMIASKQISLFCRLNTHMKRNLPIRSSEMGMLIYLVKTNEEKTPNAVAKFFNVTKAMSTNMVTSLLSKGFIQKKQSKQDKRSYILVPTKKAIQLVDNTFEEYFDTISMLEREMGEKSFQELIVLLEKANHILLEEKNNG